MNLNAMCFWTGVNAALLYVNLIDYAVSGSGWDLGMACLAAVATWLGYSVISERTPK